MNPVDDEKLIEIETKLAHQEYLLATLNDVITGQQAQISHLENLCRRLVDRVQALADAGAADPDAQERPPHY